MGANQKQLVWPGLMMHGQKLTQLCAFLIGKSGHVIEFNDQLCMQSPVLTVAYN